MKDLCNCCDTRKHGLRYNNEETTIRVRPSGKMEVFTNWYVANGRTMHQVSFDVKFCPICGKEL